MADPEQDRSEAPQNRLRSLGVAFLPSFFPALRVSVFMPVLPLKWLPVSGFCYAKNTSFSRGTKRHLGEFPFSRRRAPWGACADDGCDERCGGKSFVQTPCGEREKERMATWHVVLSYATSPPRGRQR
ncbi:hypothetical protein C0Q70_07560 [Pomacea canaliculata]|uniref:Uncharacterized protein n=1 Tax=Pomacea canaliculata TaxID=400727 RepID=A0A2T7PFD4_POMCA|nr:hypothetical protein C0Q70_07560 [Pomacea canaliculata]